VSLESATVHRLRVPMSGSYGSAHHRDFTEMESTLVVVEGAGRRGIGTADATPGYSLQTHDGIESSLLEDLLPELFEATVSTPNDLRDALGTVDGGMNAKCALESAVLDWLCRRDDESLSDLLYGRRRDRVPLNGWVGIDDPEAMADDAAGWRDHGYTSLKMKLDGEPEVDVERVAAVCDRVGDDVAVRTDVNEGYTVEESIRVARKLEAYPVVHLEQPVPSGDLDGLRRVTESTETAIMADECIHTARDAFEVISRGAADRIKLKALRMGGVFPTRRVLDAAAVADVSCVVGHGFGLTPATSAEVGLAATHDNVFGPLESVGPLKMADEPFSPLDVSEGSVTVPTGPGLGTTLDDARLDEFAVRSRAFEPADR
jgi:L-alanine-DL-glutamate epimerase-like enolase superfamily enzyme